MEFHIKEQIGSGLLLIKPKGMQFYDKQGRRVQLRGVNLGGNSKYPFIPNMPSHIEEDFFQHRDVSFCGRPFPLEEADGHYARLRNWGFNCLRFLITWEAIEHAGPGIYDEEYLDYLYQVVAKAGEYGFYVIIDPHQDVWSRFTGGDGAPGWTLEAVGLDMKGFKATGAAIVHNTHGDPFPRMVWLTNSAKLAAATMFTLFFAGNTFAPETKIEGVPVQDYLQSHYFMAILQVVQKLKGLPHVLGYESFNEPSPGWIGWQDLTQHQALAKMGDTPTPWQSMQLGEGIPQEVETWKIGLRGIRKTGKGKIDPKGQRAWLPGRTCIWRAHGVWDYDSSGTGYINNPGYFTGVNGQPLDFARDFMTPFLKEFVRHIRSVDSNATIFIEYADRPVLWTKEEAKNIVYAPHWYEPVALMLKRYLPWVTYDQEGKKIVLGRGKVRKQMVKELARFKEQSRLMLGEMPVLIGETGIAYDMQKGKAYNTGDFTAQTKAMARLIRALEKNFLNFTLWNYTADNTNERGDGWNGEDLSIFSLSQQQDPQDINSGGRALEALVRPWPRKVAGEPVKIKYNLKSKKFSFRFRQEPGLDQATEIFIPAYSYPHGFQLWVSDGSFSIDTAATLVHWQPNPSKDVHTIRISPRQPKAQT